MKNLDVLLLQKWTLESRPICRRYRFDTSIQMMLFWRNQRDWRNVKQHGHEMGGKPEWSLNRTKSFHVFRVRSPRLLPLLFETHTSNKTGEMSCIT